MIRATLKSLLSRKLRLTLSGLAVVLGVMFVSGSFVLTDTLGRSFDNLFATVFSNTDVQVRAAPPVKGEPVDGENPQQFLAASDVDKVRAASGVAAATGSVSANGARLIGSNGKVVSTIGPPRMGTNWTGESEFVKLREGRGPTAGDEIAINAALAKAGGVKVGDRVGVLTRKPKQMFTIVGIIEYAGGRDSLGGMLEVSFHESVASELMLGRPGVYSEINVTAADGTSAEALRDQLRSTLGGTYQVQTGAERQAAETAGMKEGLSFFNKILLGFAGVALFVGIFLILNTFSIIVAQRTRELALMRALGGSRRQMIGSVMVEALVIGVLSSVIGLGLGIGAGALLAWVFGNVGGAALELAGVGVPSSAVIAAFAVGIVITVVAALLPALRASRIPPMAALQEAATPDRPLTKLTVSGALIGAAGGTLLGLSLAGKVGADNQLWGILGGVLVSFVGIALLTPLIARPVVGLIGRVFSWSVPGKLGRLNSGRNPRRTAITAAALMVGIALIVGVNTVLASTKATLTEVASTQVTADLIISGEGITDTPPSFDPAVLDKTRALPGVAAVAGVYSDQVRINEDIGYVAVVTDVPATADMFTLKAVEGSFVPLGTDKVAVDAHTAQESGVHAGSTITVQAPRGPPRTLTVATVYAQSDTVGGWLMPTSLIPELDFQQPSQGYVKVRPGTSVADVRKQVDTLLADSPEVTVKDRTGFIEAQTAQFDLILRMVQILLALAVLIAVLGIVNTLALSVLERTRELGLIRAIGLNRTQTMRMVTVEAVVISVFGALLGVVVGAGLGAAVVKALENEGIKHLALPWTDMGTYLAVGAVVGVIAAILPAIRAAKVNVLQAIAYE